MNHAFLLYIISILWLILTAFCLAKYFRQPENASTQRQRHLDGLRGVLACAVIAHHSYYNFTWREGGAWGASSLPIVNLGAVAVSLFFMLSAYLHIHKIRHSPEIVWREFYWSRAKRIYPLYLAIFVLVAMISLSFRPFEWGAWWRFTGQWLLFQNASYQGFQSHLIIAGVQWTLVYEWAVYTILPLMHMIYHRKITWQWVAWLAIVFSGWVIYFHTQTRYFWLFALALPAVCLRPVLSRLVQSFSRSSLISMILLTIYIFAYTPAYSWEQRLCLMIWFAMLISGFDFKGLLQHQGLVKLGEWSYAIYLLHGLVLFMWFGVWKMFDFGRRDFVGYLWHLPWVFCCSFVLAYVGNRYIEKRFWR